MVFGRTKIRNQFDVERTEIRNQVGSNFWRSYKVRKDQFVVGRTEIKAREQETIPLI